MIARDRQLVRAKKVKGSQKKDSKMKSKANIPKKQVNTAGSKAGIL